MDKLETVAHEVRQLWNAELLDIASSAPPTSSEVIRAKCHSRERVLKGPISRFWREAAEKDRPTGVSRGRLVPACRILPSRTRLRA